MLQGMDPLMLQSLQQAMRNNQGLFPSRAFPPQMLGQFSGLLGQRPQVNWQRRLDRGGMIPPGLLMQLGMG